MLDTRSEGGYVVQAVNIETVPSPPSQVKHAYGHALEAAQADLAANPSLTDIPDRPMEGREYAEINAKYRSRCLSCRARLHPGMVVRLWFGLGVTCRRCTPSSYKRRSRLGGSSLDNP